MAFPFDRVVLTQGASAESISVEAFLSLPLPLRLRAIFEQRVEFFKADQRVELQAALKALRSG